MKSQATFKTAIFINSPDFFFLNKVSQSGLYILVEKNSLLENFARKNFAKEKIITYLYKQQPEIKDPVSLAIDDLLVETNLSPQLIKNKIEYLFIPYRSSKKIEAWSAKSGIKLIVTPWQLQDKFENKKYFAEFLRDFKIASPRRIFSLAEIKNKKSYVMQEARVSNYFRTKFFSQGYNLVGYLKAKNVELKKFVIREYLPGMAVGVSVFVDRQGNYFFSALRQQCFVYKNDFPKQFIGVQWLAANNFSQNLLKKIGNQLTKVSQALIVRGFYGLANIDLIIYNNRPFILECNPRLSISMPQVFSRSNLSAHKDSWQFFLSSFIENKKIKIKKNNIPAGNFIGSVLDIENSKKIIIKRPLPQGVYRVIGKRIIFVSSKLSDFKRRKNYFFLFHELEKNQILDKGYSLCTIFSNFCLFDRKRGVLNNSGKLLNNYFNQELGK